MKDDGSVGDHSTVCVSESVAQKQMRRRSSTLTWRGQYNLTAEKSSQCPVYSAADCWTNRARSMTCLTSPTGQKHRPRNGGLLDDEHDKKKNARFIVIDVAFQETIIFMWESSSAPMLTDVSIALFSDIITSLMLLVLLSDTCHKTLYFISIC